MAAQDLGGAADASYPHLENVYEIVYDANQSQGDAWITTYDLFNNVLINDGNQSEVLTAFERRECAFLIETGCMTVLWKHCGCTAGETTCPLSSELGRTELSTALD